MALYPLVRKSKLDKGFKNFASKLLSNIPCLSKTSPAIGSLVLVRSVLTCKCRLVYKQGDKGHGLKVPVACYYRKLVIVLYLIRILSGYICSNENLNFFCLCYCRKTVWHQTLSKSR